MIIGNNDLNLKCFQSIKNLFYKWYSSRIVKIIELLNYKYIVYTTYKYAGIF